MRIAALSVVEVVVSIGRPVTHLAVQRTVLRIRKRAVVYPDVLSLVGNQVGAVDVYRTRAYQRHVADDDVLADRLNLENTRLAGQRVDARLLILQLHHGFLRKEGSLVAGYLRTVRQRTGILIRAAQSFQILSLQISNVVRRQIELRTQACIVNADDGLVLHRKLHHLFDSEITVRTVQDDDVVLTDSLLNLRVVTLSATQRRQRLRRSIREVAATQGIRCSCLVRAYGPAPGSHIVSGHCGQQRKGTH